MKNRIIALFLAIIMVISSLAACGNQKETSTSEAIPNGDSSTLVTAMDSSERTDVDYKDLETGPANDWNNTPIPFFNPFGSHALYSEVIYQEKEALTITTLDGYTPKSWDVVGELWTLSIPAGIEYSSYWLHAYSKNLGADHFQSIDGQDVFSIQENENSLWQIVAKPEEDGATLFVIKLMTLPNSKSLTLNPAQFNGNEYGFYTTQSKGKMQSATITLKGGESTGVSLKVEGNVRYGLYEYNASQSFYSDVLNRKKTDDFVLDNLPITDGLLYWQVSLDSSDPPPDELIIRVDEIATVAPVKWGEEPGAIRVSGLPMGNARVVIPEWASISHELLPEIGSEFYGIVDENGDTLFTVPSGYYNVAFPSGIGSNDSFLRLVPVNAGEITTVNIPPEIKSSVGAMSRLYGDFDVGEGGIDLLENKDNGSSATATFILNDPKDRDAFPQKEDVTITEDGINAVITRITREPAGSDVVLVLDASGSMGENMKPCVEAAKRFVGTLPKDSNIRLIRFSQEITEFPGAGKDTVLKALDTIQAVGGTSLYDATSRALSQLKDKKNGVAVVFSDGADSREPGVDGIGSTLDKEELFSQIKESGMTVLTIGFGRNCDTSTLKKMAESSQNGAYFAAADQTLLDGAFASAAGKLGNRFTVTYERPSSTVDQNNSIPVISMMIDRSGSMDESPNNSDGYDVDFRLDRVKRVFHDFILSLPERTLLQLGSFAEPLGGEEPRYDQITTDQKAPVLQALGSLLAGGGTPTAQALELAQLSLTPISSNKRVLVFFTDAALGDPEDENEIQRIIDILAQLKASGIRVLFVGLANSSNAKNYEPIFRSAAEKSGGDYVVTDRMEVISEKLNELLKRIDKPLKNESVTFSLEVDCKGTDGSRMNFSVVDVLEEFTPRSSTATTLAPPSLVKFSTGEKLSLYERTSSELLYGGDTPDFASRVLLRMPFENKTGTNKFSKITVKEAYLMDTFKGISAPAGKCWIALDMSVAFEKSDASLKETSYLVPNILNHFYLSVNDNTIVPTSKATWLAENPLTPPEEGLLVSNNISANGALIFLADKADNETIHQLALHLYDTINGHITLPLTGGVKEHLLPLEKLPKEIQNEITESFSITVTSKSDVDVLEEMKVSASDNEESDLFIQSSKFRVLETQFNSKVQALLDIEPQKRLLYEVETDHGSLVTEMSNIVYSLPLGFAGKTMLAPGSCNNLRMPFVISKELLNTKSNLFGDLQNGTLSIPVTDGVPYTTQSMKLRFLHDYFELQINSLTRMSPESNQIILDFTMEDKKDGQGTSGLEGTLLLQLKDTLAESETSKEQRDFTTAELQQLVSGRKGFSSFGDITEINEFENAVAVDLETTEQLLYGAYSSNRNWSAFDGQKRRGLLVFTLPDGSEPADWVLTSSLLPDMNVSPEDIVYPNTALLAQMLEIPIDAEFDKALDDAVQAALATYLSTRHTPESVTRVGLSDDEILGNQIPTPSLTLYGSRLLSAVKTDKDFASIMNSQRWMPGNEGVFYNYAPEAVLTQGWGSENDLAVLAKTMLSHLGYRPSYRTVKLTTSGMDNLKDIASLSDVPSTLPAISYHTSDGTPKLYVPVFSKDLSELSAFCYLTNELPSQEISPAMGRFKIEFYGKIISTAAQGMAVTSGLFGSMADELIGESGEGGLYESITVFEKELSLPAMSLDAMDISYISTSKSNGGELLLPVLDTRQGLLFDQNGWVNTADYSFESITITLEYEGITPAVHTTILQKNQKINEICHTLAWGVPEMLPEAAVPFETMVKAESEAAKQASNYSVARWMGHATISRLVKGLTDFSRETAQSLKLTAGRSTSPIALMVTMKSDGQKAEATVDLMNHRNQIWNGENEAHNAYNMMYGFFASELEASALPGAEGISYSNVWEQLPSDSSIHLLALEDTSQFEEAERILIEKNIPDLLVKRIREQSESDEPGIVYLIPDKPAIINGKPRWAWLEINQNTYDVVSVFETGERAGMSEYIIGLLPENCAEVGVGAIVGISTSLWSVSTFVLTTDDYTEIMEQSKAQCLGIGKYLKAVSSGKQTVEGTGKISEMIKEHDFSYAFTKNIEIYENLWIQPDFNKGYEEAVNWYFDGY